MRKQYVIQRANPIQETPLEEGEFEHIITAPPSRRGGNSSSTNPPCEGPGYVTHDNWKTLILKNGYSIEGAKHLSYSLSFKNDRVEIKGSPSDLKQLVGSIVRSL